MESPGQEEDSGEMSICRDEPLFSPIKECGPPLLAQGGSGCGSQGGAAGGVGVAGGVGGGTLSTDSLDVSSFEEHDLVLTCQANKDNYTIAFQQSGTHFSDDLSEGSLPPPLDQLSHLGGGSTGSTGTPAVSAPVWALDPWLFVCGRCNFPEFGLLKTAATLKVSDRASGNRSYISIF